MTFPTHFNPIISLAFRSYSVLLRIRFDHLFKVMTFIAKLITQGVRSNKSQTHLFLYWSSFGKKFQIQEREKKIFLIDGELYIKSCEKRYCRESVVSDFSSESWKMFLIFLDNDFDHTLLILVTSIILQNRKYKFVHSELEQHLLHIYKILSKRGDVITMISSRLQSFGNQVFIYEKRKGCK